MRRRTPSAIGAAFLAALVVAPAALADRGKPLPPLVEGPRDALTRALEHGQISPATYALERATALFARGAVERRYGEVARPDPRSATLVLRDLAFRVGRLGPAERERARSLLARPTDNPNPDDGPNTYGTAEATPLCDANVCIHYVTSSTSPHVAAPAYANLAFNVFADVVWPTIVTTMGYRAPKSDVTSPNNGLHPAADADGSEFDVYLANLGDDFIYGYCTTDDPNHVPGNTYEFWDASAYCVLDNDYAEFDFTGNTELENLQVTAAHEFFHAVQFAYDAFEDRWLMEASATWIEDELYDDVDDNVQYLEDGPLARPGVPLDKLTDDLHIYGDWIFFRFLAEHFGELQGIESDPTVVRQVWNRADGASGGLDNYSIQAIKNVLSNDRSTSFTRMFGMFGWVNRVPGRWYEEGAANAYPQAPLSARAMTLTPGSATKSKSVTMNHQTSKYFQLRRGSGVKAGAKLRITLNLPDKSTGSAASALVYPKSGGKPTQFSLAISSTGNGTFSLPFGSSVSKVELVLTNASTRYASCWSGYPNDQWLYACGGKPRDDGRTYKFTAKLA